MIVKHKTLQILVNLLSNAKNAMKDLNGNAERRLLLRLATAVTADGPRVRIAVTDNGCGIAAEHLTRIFAHGFTTRAEGHGFGLHSAVNAAKEMGGSLQVASDGIGRGATFTLELPLARSNNKVAA
jgi:C4-dicarboxylate-specific signal transduction histidine kinase